MTTSEVEGVERESEGELVDEGETSFLRKPEGAPLRFLMNLTGASEDMSEIKLK